MAQKKKNTLAPKLASVVRPKASSRKGRSDKINHSPRRPQQDRSLQRFEAILRATEELLRNSNIEDISFYDIARQAKISPASVHYLFPTMAALRIELSERYNHFANEHLVAALWSLGKMKKPTWQEAIRMTAGRSRDWLITNRHYCEVLLGPLPNRESRRTNIASTDRFARAFLENLRRVFVIPEIPGFERMLSLIFEIADGLMSRAYILTGSIDDVALEELVQIQIACLRRSLPETLPYVRDRR